MKEICLILLLVSITGFTQNQEATIHFNDGTSVEGYGKIFSINKIKFRASLEDKADTWTNLMVSSITFHGFEYDETYEYHYTENHKLHPLLLKVISTGEISLYENIITNKQFTPLPYKDVFSLRQTDGSITVLGHVSPKYYIKRDHDEFALKLKGSLKKIIQNYFHSCNDVILKKMKKERLNKTDIPYLFDFYNDYCGELD